MANFVLSTVRFKAQNLSKFGPANVVLRFSWHRYCTEVKERKANKQGNHELERTRFKKDPCNISRLPEHLRCKLAHVNKIPHSFYSAPRRNLKSRRNDMRETYAMMGRSSKIDPAVMWDTKQEYLEHFAKDLQSPSLEETLRDHLQMEKRTAEMKYEVLENAKVRMEVILPELFEKKREMKKNFQNRKIKERKATKWHAIMEEARDYLGYEVNRQDPEVRALVDRNKQAELERRRSERKAAKRARLMGVVPDKPTADSKKGGEGETGQESAG